MPVTGPSRPPKPFTVWLAIDDATVENGAMRFIAGSHHLGHLTPRHSNPDENSVLGQIVEDAEQYGETVNIELKAGENLYSHRSAFTWVKRQSLTETTLWSYTALLLL